MSPRHRHDPRDFRLTTLGFPKNLWPNPRMRLYCSATLKWKGEVSADEKERVPRTIQEMGWLRLRPAKLALGQIWCAIDGSGLLFSWLVGRVFGLFLEKKRALWWLVWLLSRIVNGLIFFCDFAVLQKANWLARPSCSLICRFFQPTSVQVRKFYVQRQVFIKPRLCCWFRRQSPWQSSYLQLSTTRTLLVVHAHKPPLWRVNSRNPRRRPQTSEASYVRLVRDYSCFSRKVIR